MAFAETNQNNNLVDRIKGRIGVERALVNEPFYTIPLIFSNANRKRGCNNHLNGNDPASRYQKLKLIQNTVRVPSSLYTMNLGALNVYEPPNDVFQEVVLNGAQYIISPGVNWNQMSDRRIPHEQKVVSGSGSTYGGNSLKRTLTRLRPGALSPGGYGVDIKHNSYDRYLARIKAKAPLRRGIIPKTFASGFIPFNRAYPIYGGKEFKTAIIERCKDYCSVKKGEIAIDKLFGSTDLQSEILNITYTFTVGQTVYVEKPTFNTLFKATIQQINGTDIVIQFIDDLTTTVINNKQAKIFVYDRCITDACRIDNAQTSTDVKYVIDNILYSCTADGLTLINRSI